jgi:hypothetical protein
MIMKLMTVAATSITITACSAQMAETNGYLYPSFWRAPAATALASSRLPEKQDPATTMAAPADTAIFGTHIDSANSPGIWLFPPDELDGGQ